MTHSHDFIRQTVWVDGIGSDYKVVCFICNAKEN